jgi:hypothetical protein
MARDDSAPHLHRPRRMLGQLYHCLQRGRRFDETVASPSQ